MSLSGLAQINLELSSRCDKHNLCAFCGHQDSAINAGLVYGDIDFDLLSDIRQQLDTGVVIQFHRDGDPLVYPRLRDALDLFGGFTTNLVTHGEMLAARAGVQAIACRVERISRRGHCGTDPGVG